MLVIISGSSGAGKNTVMNELFKRDIRLKKLVTYTTRDKRAGEVDHVNYHYISKDEFNKKLNNGEIMEYEIIHQNMYGSSMVDLKNEIDKGFILVNDFGVEGMQNIKKNLKGTIPVMTIYLTVPKDVLFKRLVKRGDKLDNIELRMERYDYELSFVNDYDYVINNLDLNETVKTIYGLIKGKLNELECEK